MISFNRGFLFIHIAKTGGNSIQSILKKHSEDKILSNKEIQDGVNRFEVYNEEYEIYKHASIREYMGKIGEERVSNLFTFTVVRNPWERAISNYFSPHRKWDGWDKRRFEEMVNEMRTVREYVCSRGIIEKIEDRVGKIPMSYLAKERLDRRVDFFIDFRNLNRDFRKVCTKLGLEKEDLPVRNKSSRDHYSEYYDQDTKEMVEYKFREEIDFFGFEFEGSISW